MVQFNLFKITETFFDIFPMYRHKFHHVLKTYLYSIKTSPVCIHFFCSFYYEIMVKNCHLFFKTITFLVSYAIYNSQITLLSLCFSKQKRFKILNLFCIIINCELLVNFIFIILYGKH